MESTLGPHEFKRLEERFAIDGAVLPLTPPLPEHEPRVAQHLPMVAEQGEADPGAPGQLRPTKFFLLRQHLDQAEPRGVAHRVKDASAGFESHGPFYPKNQIVKQLLDFLDRAEAQ